MGVGWGVTQLASPFDESVARQEMGLMVTLERATQGEGHFASGVAGKKGRTGFVEGL